MMPGFAHILNTLRRENNLSQKKAADDLGISQALLSHYENGVREPKLEFIIKACEYYGVSTDYILGRTAVKSYNGISLNYTNDGQRRNANAASFILSLLSDIGDEQLNLSATRYINFLLFIVLSSICYPPKQYEPLFDAALKIAENTFVDNIRRVKEKPLIAKKLSDSMLKDKYPDQFTSMLELEEIINKELDSLRSDED